PRSTICWWMSMLSSLNGALLPAEVHEKSAPVLGVFFDPVVQGFYFFLVQEPEHVLLQLAGPFAGNDLDHRRLLRHRLVDDGAQRPVDIVSSVIDVVQVQLELHHAVFLRAHPSVTPCPRARSAGCGTHRAAARASR